MSYTQKKIVIPAHLKEVTTIYYVFFYTTDHETPFLHFLIIFVDVVVLCYYLCVLFSYGKFN